MPWYLLWVLHYAALARSAHLRRPAVVLVAFLLPTLAPIGWLLAHRSHGNASDAETGQRSAVEIREHLR